jgi:phosphatidylinositol glycan class F
MSTSPSRAAAASQRQSKPQYSPISLLDTDLARVYTHIHPLTILSIYFLSFKLVVADPVSALASLLVPLIALQAVYVVVCLPPTGSHSVPGHGKTGAGAGAVGKKAAGGGKKDGLTLGMRVIVCFHAFPSLCRLSLSLCAKG